MNSDIQNISEESPKRLKLSAEEFLVYWKMEKVPETKHAEHVKFDMNLNDEPQIEFSFVEITGGIEVRNKKNQNALPHLLFINSEVGDFLIQESSEVGDFLIQESSKVGDFLILENSQTGSFSISGNSQIGDVEILSNSKIGDFKIIGDSKLGNVQIRENSEAENFLISENSQAGYFWILKNSRIGNFLIRENSETQYFKISESSHTGDFLISENSETNNFEILENSSTKDFLILENSFVGKFKISENSHVKDFKVSENCHAGDFLITENSQLRDFSISGDSCASEIYFTGKSNIRKLTISSGARIGRVTIENSFLNIIQIENVQLIEHFHCRFLPEQTTQLVFKNTIFGHLDFEDTVFPESTTLSASNCKVNKITFKNSCNYGGLFFGNLEPIESYTFFKKDRYGDFYRKESEYQFEVKEKSSLFRMEDSELGRL